MTTSQPRTLAEDLRSRSDEQISELLTARPDLVHPIPSDMRALTTRASTGPSIARYLDDIDVLHHYTLRVACDQTATEPTTTKDIVKDVVAAVDKKARPAIEAAIAQLRTAALLWGTDERTHVVTSVRDQVANAPIPTWPPPECGKAKKSSLDKKAIDAQSGAQAQSVLSIVEETGDLWRTEPGAVLRSGGLSTRSFDALVTHLGADRFTVLATLDIAHSAGLLSVGATDSDLGWMPTERFEEWRLLPASKRWAQLIKAWRSRAFTTSDRPLAPDEHPFTTTWRQHLLAVLLDATSSCDVATAIDVIDYRWPRRRGEKRSQTLNALWQEAEAIGVIAHDSLTSAGIPVAEGADTAVMAKAIGSHLVSEVDRVHVQADHTIVAPGPLDPHIGRQLRDIADVESRGHGSVLRISNASIGRALSIEPDAQAWIDFLSGISTKDLPQPVEYAITDGARSSGKTATIFTAPNPPAPARHPRATATPASVDKALRVLRAHEVREVIDQGAEPEDIPAMDSSAVVASLKYAIDHNETVHLTHAESDGSTAVLLVDPIRLGGGSLTAYDHHQEQVRTLAISRISGVVAIQLSA